MRLDPHIIKAQINALKVAHPDLLEDDETWAMTLESETDLDGMLTSIVRRIEDTKALVIGTKDRFDELKSRKDRFENRVEALRSLAFKLMEAANVSKLELPEATLSLRNVAPAVVIVDEEKLPDIACKFERKPDKAKIKELLSTGMVAGAAMSNGGKTVSIRVK
jgi:hypothetical protein